MSYSVTISIEAEKDLREIFEYIYFKLQSPQSAELQLNRIVKAIKSLDEMPYRFKKYNCDFCKTTELRMITIDNYCVFFIPRENDKTVTIIRVVYGARNLPDVLIET